MVDAIVIGAGVTGLTVGYKLKEQNKNFLIIDPENPGGLIKSLNLENFTLELGANLLVAKPALEKLIKNLGLESKQVFPKYEKFNQYVWIDNKARLIPKNLNHFFKTDLINFKDKILLATRLFKKGLLTNSAVDLSVAQFLEPLTKNTNLLQVVDAALQGIYGGDIYKLSAKSIFSTLWEESKAEQSLLKIVSKKPKYKLFILKNGNETLIKSLINFIDVKNIIKDKVTSLSFNESSKTYQVQLHRGQTLAAKKVYICTSGNSTANYFNEAYELNKINYAPLVVIHVAVPKKIIFTNQALGVLFPTSARTNLLGIMFNSQIFPNTGTQTENLLTLCFGGKLHSEILQVSENTIKEIVYKELKDKLKIIPNRILKTTYWEKAIPQYETGHTELVLKMRNLENRFPGLHFVGSDQAGIGVADRVSSVLKCFNAI